MEKWFDVAGLEAGRLLAEWRWLCPEPVTLIARNVFGELFLQDQSGSVFWLNTTAGRLDKIADSHSEFRDLAESGEKRQKWFVEKEEMDYARLGLVPETMQCIGFGVPAVFAEVGTHETAYIADIYEHISFLGDLHKQIANVPNGSKVRLRIDSPKPASKSGDLTLET